MGETAGGRLNAASVTFGDSQLEGMWTPAPDAVAVAVMAHGAGAGMDHPFMEGLAAGLSADSVSVLRFNFPYIQQGRRSPDRPAVLMDAWVAARAEGARRGGGLPVVAGGKSLGGRMASMLAAEDPAGFPVSALVFVSYPLHAPGRSDRPRDAHLSGISVPMLFLQGTADPLATFALMEDVVGRLGSRATLHPVEGGDHSFRIRGARRSDEEIGRELGAVAAGFIREVTA